MARYTKASIQSLRDHTDIVEIIGHYVPLKRAGAAYKGCCPFHDEKTPSFTVNKASGHYHCFGCNAHGDSISFLMQHERMTFHQSVEYIAERMGVQLVQEESQSIEEIEEEKKKNKLKLCNEAAMLFFHENLRKSSEAQVARDYLAKRAISDEFISAFGLGYMASSQEGQLINHLLKKGCTRQEMGDAGLLAKGSGREFFIDRIVFPILDARGFVVGFSGRKIKESTFGGKYINTPETLLFKKNRTLFGLYYSKKKIAKERACILVEGQVDALQLIHAGFQMTVATLGTAFSQSHVDMLKGLGVEQVFLAFDQDVAGLASAKKAGQLLQTSGIDVKVVLYEEAKDPDELLAKGGSLLFFDKLMAASGFLEFLVAEAKKTFDFSSPTEKQKAVEEIRLQVFGWNNSILIHESIHKLSQLTSIPEALLKEGMVSLVPMRVAKEVPLQQKKMAYDQLEGELLRWLFFSLETHPEISVLVKKHFSACELQTPLFQRLLDVFLHLVESKRPLLVGTLLDFFDTEELGEYIKLFSEPLLRLDKASIAVKELLNKIKERNWRLQREKIREAMQQAAGDEQQQLCLAKELALLTKKPSVV